MISFFRPLACFSAMALTLLVSSPTEAGPAKDALLGCFSRVATDDDLAAISEQIYNSMAERDGITSSAAGAESVRRRGSTALSRLMNKDCASEARLVEKSEGPEGIKLAVGQLGILAMTQMLGKISSEEAVSASSKSN